MKKRFLAAMMAVLLFCGMMVPAFAAGGEEQGSEATRNRAELLMANFGEYKVSNVVGLFNIYGELEVYCYLFEPTGYVIVNINDLSVPEFSPGSNYIVDDDCRNQGKLIYNGPLSYVVIDDSGEMKDLRSGKTISIDDISYVYSARDKRNNDVAMQDDGDYSSRAVISSVICKTRPALWGSSYYCGLDAVAIVLNQLNKAHYSINISSINQNTALQKYLLDNYYIPDEGTNASEIVYGVGNYRGVNALFSDLALRTVYLAYYNSYSASGVSDKMRNNFSKNYPVILGTEALPKYEDHWLIAYGYYFDDSSSAFWIVNDGWGAENIYVDVYSDYYDDVIFFDGM